MAEKDDWDKPRSHGQHLTESEIELIRCGYRNCRRVRDVARELRCSSRIVSKYYAVFRGRNPNARRANRLQPWEHQAVVDAYAAGEKLEAVAAEFGCSISAVSKAGRRAGHPPRRMRRQPVTSGDGPKA